jgi:hypothetical protein
LNKELDLEIELEQVITQKCKARATGTPLEIGGAPEG